MRDKVKETRGWLSRLNVQWPWLKVLLTILLIGGVALGCAGAAWQNAVREAENVALREEDREEVVDDEGREGATEVTETTEPTEKSEIPETLPPQETSEISDLPASLETTASVVPQYTGKKLVALTFDDGPSVATTARLLDVLAAKQVKVTFFVLGYMAQKSPDLVKRAVAEGHEVESHTMWHQNLANLSVAAIQGEVTEVDTVLKETIGRPAKLVRPPYGSINETVRTAVDKPMILWTVDPEDWKYRDAATVRGNVVSHVFDGSVVLMHDIYGTTVDAVANIIDDLRAAGYEFLTVSEMAAIRGVALQNGYSYGSFRP